MLAQALQQNAIEMLPQIIENCQHGIAIAIATVISYPIAKAIVNGSIMLIRKLFG